MEESIIKLEGNVARWTLADDNELCTLLEQVTNSIISRCGNLESKLSELTRNTGILDASIQDMNCSIMLLANTKFIEQKVQEDCHISVSNPAEKSSNCDVNSQAKTIDVIQNAIDKGIELFSQLPLTSFGDHIHTNGSITSSSRPSSDPLVAYSSPLPAIIGSTAFFSPPPVISSSANSLCSSTVVSTSLTPGGDYLPKPSITMASYSPTPTGISSREQTIIGQFPENNSIHVLQSTQKRILTKSPDPVTSNSKLCSGPIDEDDDIFASKSLILAFDADNCQVGSEVAPVSGENLSTSTAPELTTLQTVINQNENISPVIFANEIRKAAERIQNKITTEDTIKKVQLKSTSEIIDDKPTKQFQSQSDRLAQNESHTSKGILKNVFDSDSDDEDSLFKSLNKSLTNPVSIDRVSDNKVETIKRSPPVLEIKTKSSSSKFKSLFDSDSDAEDLFKSIQDTPINHRSPAVQTITEPVGSPTLETRTKSPDISLSKTSVVKSDEGENMPGKLSNSAFANILNSKLSMGPPSLVGSRQSSTISNESVEYPDLLSSRTSLSSTDTIPFGQNDSESSKFLEQNTELLGSVNKSRPKGPSRRPPRKKLENVIPIDSSKSTHMHIGPKVESPKTYPSQNHSKIDKDEEARTLNGSASSSMVWKTSKKSSAQKSLFESDSEDDELFKNIKMVNPNAVQKKRENTICEVGKPSGLKTALVSSPVEKPLIRKGLFDDSDDNDLDLFRKK